MGADWASGSVAFEIWALALAACPDVRHFAAGLTLRSGFGLRKAGDGRRSRRGEPEEAL